MEITRHDVMSPVGKWVVEGHSGGVTHVYLPNQSAPRATAKVDSVVEAAARQLADYFSGDLHEFTVTLADVTATEFQRSVWQALSSIAYGDVATYSDIARRTGRPHAARAVGNANHANPWPIFVPCHRVVAATGLGGYGGGLGVKEFLLHLESQHVPARI